MKTRIKSLALAFTHARNLQLRKSYPVKALELLADDITEIEPFLQNLIDKAQEIKVNGDLSKEGKKKAIAQAIETISAEVAKLDKTESLSQDIEDLEKKLTHKGNQAREDNREKDSVLAYLQASDIRRHLQTIQEEKVDGLTSDQDKQSNRVEGLFLDACKDYSKENAAFIEAVLTAPVPFEVLPVEVLHQGVELLNRSVAPELATELEVATSQAELNNIAMAAVNEILDNPDRQQLSSPARRPLSDQERAGITA